MTSSSPDSPKSAGPQAILRGSAIIAAIKASGIEFVAALPDITTSEGVLKPIAKDPALRLISVCKEDEGIGICAGLAYCDKRALLLIQSTGLMDSVNALRALAVDYRQPICVMVGMIGNEAGRPPRESENAGVRIVQPILDTMGIAHHLLETAADVALIKPAIDKAYMNSTAVVLLIGTEPAVS